MRKLKKFKRYEEGGAVGSGSGDPFSYTDFSDRARNLREPSKAAPIEERKPPKAKEAKKETKAEEAAEPAQTSPVKTPNVAQQMKDREKGGPNERANYASSGNTSRPEYDSYSYGPDYLADGNEGVDSSTSTGNAKKAEAYRQSLMPVSKPKPKPPAPAAEKTPATSSKPSYVGAGDSDDSVDTKKKNELDRLKRVGSGAVEQTMMGPVETIAFGASKLPSMARAGFGAARKASDEFTSSSGGKGTGKFPEAKPEIQVSNKPAVERVKDAKIEGPPKPPRQETPLRETSAMEKTRKANEVGPPDLGARARRVAEDAAKDTKQGEEVMAAAGRRATQNRADQKQAADAMAAANKRARDNRADQKQAADVMAAAGARAKQNRAENKQASDVMAAAKKRANTNRAQQRSDKIPQKDREPGYMQEYIAGRAEKRNRIKDLPNDGLSAERFANKKGGKIPAFKKGGLVGRGDGCAMRGKTKGRMV